MWNADRTYYGSCRQPDAFERAELWAQGELHWLNVRTRQNLAHILKSEQKEPPK